MLRYVDLITLGFLALARSARCDVRCTMCDARHATCDCMRKPQARACSSQSRAVRCLVGRAVTLDFDPACLKDFKPPFQDQTQCQRSRPAQLYQQSEVRMPLNLRIRIPLRLPGQGRTSASHRRLAAVSYRGATRILGSMLAAVAERVSSTAR